jgi:hypothetical protein
MAEPYVLAKPNDIITSHNWNQMQILARQEIDKHTAELARIDREIAAIGKSLTVTGKVLAGQVGIGQGDLNAKLFVVNQEADPNMQTAAFFKPKLGDNWSHVHWGPTGDWYIRSAKDGGKVVIQDTPGSVGIGTGNLDADHRLQVNGETRTGGITITAVPNWRHRGGTDGAVVTALDGHSSLMIVGSNQGKKVGPYDMNRWIRMWDNVTVEGSLDVGLPFGGNNRRNLNVQGEVKSFGGAGGFRMEDRSAPGDSNREWVILSADEELRFWNGQFGVRMALQRNGRLICDGVPVSTHIESGSFYVDVGNPAFVPFRDGTGQRQFRQFIQFPRAFNQAPTVITAFRHLDTYKDANTRLWVDAHNVRTNGFDLVITTWGDSKAWGVGAVWIAQGY